MRWLNAICDKGRVEEEGEEVEEDNEKDNDERKEDKEDAFIFRGLVELLTGQIDSINANLG